MVLGNGSNDTNGQHVGLRHVVTHEQHTRVAQGGDECLVARLQVEPGDLYALFTLHKALGRPMSLYPPAIRPRYRDKFPLRCAHGPKGGAFERVVGTLN